MINIVNVNDDGGEIDPTAAARFITDNNSKTNWATNGTNRYVQFDFEKEESLDAVEVIFNPAYNRTAKFDIQTSIDGVNFETIYSGTSDKSVTAKDVWQTYKLNGQKAKYVRYVGQGSDKNNWNGVIEIRFIKK